MKLFIPILILHVHIFHFIYICLFYVLLVCCFLFSSHNFSITSHTIYRGRDTHRVGAVSVATAHTQIYITLAKSGKVVIVALLLLLLPDYTTVLGAESGRHRNSALWSARRRTQDMVGLESHARTLVARLFVYCSLCLYACLVACQMNARSPTNTCTLSDDQTNVRIQTRTECY